ncbi:unnamed protein product, partial [Angiostrongylus costaricensis]|uniref:DM domain-containing protein n=1 Tax=Angiostrongylus costaricensis TaxID=334426 RepID=A0A0R3PCV3_ANGCS
GSSLESEIDVVALSPAPSQSSCNSTQTEKKYFCQRCLNHDLQFPRKGHKPMCKFVHHTIPLNLSQTQVLVILPDMLVVRAVTVSWWNNGGS